VNHGTPARAGKTIDVIVNEEPDESDGSMGVLSGPLELAVKAVPVDALRENIRELMDSLGHLFAQEEQGDAAAPLRLSEVEVGLSITATGGVRLVGTAEMAAQGAVKLTFRRS